MTSKKRFDWGYCECGCHQNELSIAGRYFTVYNDLKGKLYFAEGHNARYSRTIFGSYDEVNAEVTKILREDWELLNAVVGD